MSRRVASSPFTISRFGLPRSLIFARRFLKLFAAVGLFTTTIFEIRACDGFSMMPTINWKGDWVLTSPIPYWSPSWLPFKKQISRGDVVFAASPTDPRATVCKRVIGIAGDIIEVDPRRGEGLARKKRMEDRTWVTIPKGQVWLAGDNTSNSTDSRDYGPVPLAMVHGQVLARVSRQTKVYR
ncbi:peptidase S24/S26A/S26B/S26C [Kockovaella imperatae]|uniref:Mitochondrial inner membrane protease subunit n=1 Tax=Kockovaella imperatae TaxID=4999 RepID=A0A1Y1U9I0_9TREE|nr:peptidase S24/S26A/S26B/S26C [Kockovaella imperatae]ORX34691.1 peptidase S24/S26A/S26B/S26C [Kockovaella imperatae]